MNDGVIKLIEAFLITKMHPLKLGSPQRLRTSSFRIAWKCVLILLTTLVWISNRLSKKELIDKIKGTIYGNCLGDAVGLATEFMTKEYAMRSYKRPLSFSKFVQDDHRSRWVAGDYLSI